MLQEIKTRKQNILQNSKTLISPQPRSRCHNSFKEAPRIIFDVNSATNIHHFADKITGKTGASFLHVAQISFLSPLRSSKANEQNSAGIRDDDGVFCYEPTAMYSGTTPMNVMKCRRKKHIALKILKTSKFSKQQKTPLLASSNRWF